MGEKNGFFSWPENVPACLQGNCNTRWGIALFLAPISHKTGAQNLNSAIGSGILVFHIVPPKFPLYCIQRNRRRHPLTTSQSMKRIRAPKPGRRRPANPGRM